MVAQCSSGAREIDKLIMLLLFNVCYYGAHIGASMGAKVNLICVNVRRLRLVRTTSVRRLDFIKNIIS